MKAKLRPIKVDVDRWWQNGDHPEDGCHSGSVIEGRVVRRFRHPDLGDETPCDVCGDLLHNHGWLDTGGDGKRVCPGNFILKTRHDNYIPISRNYLLAYFDIIGEI